MWIQGPLRAGRSIPSAGIYHVPAILFAGYGHSASALFGLAAFTVTVIPLSIFLGAARILSGSLWPAAFFHAAHNLLFLHVFDPVKKTSPPAAWLVGEQGALLCVGMAVLAGVGFVLERRDAARASLVRAHVGQDNRPLGNAELREVAR